MEYKTCLLTYSNLISIMKGEFKMELCNLTWQDAKEWSKRNPVVIIPVGSTEQHGPHLPLKVDIVTADYIARKVAEKTNMLVTPPLNFGYSELWKHYPGTISFRKETFETALHDICTSLIRGGFKKLFILNGHNPNLILLQAVLYGLIDELDDEDIKLGGASYFHMAPETCDVEELFKDGTHANEIETSIMLELFPECVKMKEAEIISRKYTLKKVINFDRGAVFVDKWPKSEVFNGVYGNPGLATKEKGKSRLEEFINSISKVILDFDKGKFDTAKKGGIPIDF